MSAGVYDFNVEQGVPKVFQVIYKNPDGTGKNITGWDYVGQIKYKVNDCEPICNFLIEPLDPVNGSLLVTVPVEEIAAIKIKGNNYTDFTTLVYDIKIWPIADKKDIRRLLNGTIKVSPQVTK